MSPTPPTQIGASDMTNPSTTDFDNGKAELIPPGEQTMEMAAEKDSTRYHGADYKEFWTGPTKDHINSIEQRIVRRLLRGGEAVAEVGAGYGRLATCYLQRYDRVFLVEPAHNLRAQAAETYGNAVECVDASVYRLPFDDDSLDALLMVRVMHHLTDPHAALTELRRVLKPRGVLLFSYSNKRNLGRVIRFLAGGGNDPFTADVERYGEVLFGHHPVFMQGVVHDVGMSVEARYGVGLLGKIVDRAPALAGVLYTPLSLAGVAGRLSLSPTLFWLIQKI